MVSYSFMKALLGVIDIDDEDFCCLIWNSAFHTVVLKVVVSTENPLNSTVSNGLTVPPLLLSPPNVKGSTIARITPMISRIITAPHIIFFFLALAASSASVGLSTVSD